MADNVRRIAVRKRRSRNTANGNGNDGNANGINTDSTGAVSGRNVFRLGSDNSTTDASDNASGITANGTTDGSRESGPVNDSGSDGSNGRNDNDGSGTGTADAIGSDADNSRSADGQPRKLRRGRKPGSKNKSSQTSLVLEDVEDISNIVVAIGDAAKVATGFDGFEIPKEEAETFAKPAARILARHGALAETIRTVADPFALIIAGASIAGPRIAAYNMYRKMYGNVQPPQQRETVQQAPTQTAAPTNGQSTLDPSTVDLALRFMQKE